MNNTRIKKVYLILPIMIIVISILVRGIQLYSAYMRTESYNTCEAECILKNYSRTDSDVDYTTKYYNCRLKYIVNNVPYYMDIEIPNSNIQNIEKRRKGVSSL